MVETKNDTSYPKQNLFDPLIFFGKTQYFSVGYNTCYIYKPSVYFKIEESGFRRFLTGNGFDYMWFKVNYRAEDKNEIQNRYKAN